MKFGFSHVGLLIDCNSLNHILLKCKCKSFAFNEVTQAILLRYINKIELILRGARCQGFQSKCNANIEYKRILVPRHDGISVDLWKCPSFTEGAVTSGECIHKSTTIICDRQSRFLSTEGRF